VKPHVFDGMKRAPLPKGGPDLCREDPRLARLEKACHSARSLPSTPHRRGALICDPEFAFGNGFTLHVEPHELISRAELPSAERSLIHRQPRAKHRPPGAAA